MLAKFRSWYMSNYTQITWFLIGWLVFGGFINLGQGNYVEAIVLWVIALINYVFVKRD